MSSSLVDASDVARWATAWQITEVVEDHEEGEEEEKEPIHSLVGRVGGERHGEEGGGWIYSFGIVLSMFIVHDNSKLSSIPLFGYLKLMLAQRTPRAADIFHTFDILRYSINLCTLPSLVRT
eukprot:scaffold18984_cov211-Skeletonema_marinoi.AAC.5